MEGINQTKQLILEAKNICLIPSENEPEAIVCALALFYTLKELGKNANLILENFPEKFNFLIPSLDFVSQPKNFVISIPRSVADVSQIYYEKTEENLKIHLTLDNGQVKKENIAFYFQEPKPDLIITLGIKDFRKHLENNLDSFGFLLDSPILNIDALASTNIGSQDSFDVAQGKNIKFGKINLIEQKSISEIILGIIKSIDENLVKNKTASCILTGLNICYENFKSEKTSPEIFEIAADLIKKGAENKKINENLNKTTEKEADFLLKILQNLKNNGEIYVAALNSGEFEDFGEEEARLTVDKLKTIGVKNDLLVLWQSHASDVTVKGFFYSKKPDLVNRISKNNGAVLKKDWAFLLMGESDINLAESRILSKLINFS